MLILAILIIAAIVITASNKISHQRKQARAMGAKTFAEVNATAASLNAIRKRDQWIRKHPTRAAKRGYSREVIDQAIAKRFTVDG
jgi:hypothetical protein